MAHVFISYSRKDKAFASELKKQLHEAGLNEWMDNKIPGGKRWLEEIEAQLRNSYAIVIIVTEESVSSEWVNYEWVFARGADVEIIPIYLHDVKKFPCRLNDYQLIDFRNTYQWKSLIDRLQDLSQNAIDREPLQRAKIDLNNTDPQIQKNAIKALIDMNAIETLALSVSHPNRTIRIASSFALSEVTKHTDKRAISGLLEAIKDTDWSIRQDAANALGKTGDYGTVPALISSLNDSDANVCLAATKALGEIRDPSSIPSLINKLCKSPHIAIQIAAGESLARIGAPSVPNLIDIIDDKDTKDSVLIDVAHILERIGDSKAVSSLMHLLYAKNWDIRKSAIRALGSISDPKAILELVKIISDPQNIELDKVSAAALEKMGEPAIPHLLGIVQNPHASVRKLVIETLGAIGARDSIPHLINALCDSKYEVQNAATLTLIRFGKACLEQILAKITNSNSCGREHAIEVLGEIGDEENTETLLKILREEGKENSRICLATIHALGNIGDPTAVPDLINQLSNKTIVNIVASLFGVIEIQISQHASYALEKIRTPEALAAVAAWKREQEGE